MTDANTNIVWTWQYGTFGEEPLTMELNAISQNLRFPGQYYDAETGLHYNFHRYYSPKLGRYLQHDPILDSLIYNYSSWLNPGFAPGLAIFALTHNPSKLPSYTYTRNNPINYFDLRGLDTWSIAGGSLTLGAGPGASGTFLIVADSQGNIGYSYSSGPGGVAGVGKNVSYTFQWTNADSIYQLEGPNVQTGGSYGPLGLEWVVGSNYQGFNVNITARGEFLEKTEIHSILEFASVKGVNIFDILNYIEKLLKGKSCS